MINISRALEYGTYDNSTFSNTLGYDAVFGGWNVETRLNHTKTENNFFLPIPRSVYGSQAEPLMSRTSIIPRIELTKPGQPGTTTDVNTLPFAATVGIIVGGQTDTDAT